MKKSERLNAVVGWSNKRDQWEIWLGHGDDLGYSMGAKLIDRNPETNYGFMSDRFMEEVVKLQRWSYHIDFTMMMDTWLESRGIC